MMELNLENILQLIFFRDNVYGEYIYICIILVKNLISGKLHSMYNLAVLVSKTEFTVTRDDYLVEPCCLYIKYYCGNH